MLADQLQAEQDRLLAAVTKVEDADDAIIAYVQGVPAIIKTAVDAALAAGATPEQLAPFGIASDRIAASAQKVVDAVNANT